MIVSVKRVLFFILLTVAAAGVVSWRLFFSEPNGIKELSGEYTSFSNGFERVDMLNTETESAEAVLRRFCAAVLWTEQVDGIRIVYAYSVKIQKYKTVRGQKVNLMIAKSGDRLSVGCPLLSGSY